MKIDEAQLAAKACLVANNAFAGLAIFCELDAEATPAELAAFDTEFETALATKGLAIVILSPHALALDQIKPRGGAGLGSISMDLIVPVAICENPEVNRGEANAEVVPPRTPAGLNSLSLLEAAISALLTKFSFPAQPFGRPEFADGFLAYYLLAQRQCTIRSA